MPGKIPVPFNVKPIDGSMRLLLPRSDIELGYKKRDYSADFLFVVGYSQRSHNHATPTADNKRILTTNNELPTRW